MMEATSIHFVSFCKEVSVSHSGWTIHKDGDVPAVVDADGYYALKVMHESEGWGEDVTDAEIIQAMKLLAKTEGIFTESAGGVTVGVTQRLVQQSIIPRDESILIYITGNGLKTQETVMGEIGQPLVIEPNIDAFHRVASQKGPR